MKASFILYCDLWDTIKYLDKSQLGELTTIIFEYMIEGKTITPENPLFFLFNPIKNTLDRDKEKYLSTCEKRKEAGKKGGLSKGKQKQAKKANAKFAKQTLANEADSDSDSDNVSVSVNVNENVKKENRVFKSVIEIRGMTFFEKSEKLNEAFKDFLINRITNKDYPTTLGIKSLMKKMPQIYKTEQEALDGIARSIEGNYKGLFEPNKNNNPKQPQTSTVTRASMGLKMQ
jgi:hypothetical protein